jgi:hypothetical protein
MIRFTIPIRVDNPLNGPQGRSRAAMLGKAAKRKKQRNAARVCCMEKLDRIPGLGLGTAIVLRRVSPRALDGDGLQAALKSVRDGIADALGINDGSDAVTWRYEWRRGGPRFYAVEVEILPNQPAEQPREAMT